MYPNVFYELGIAHMVKDVEKVILITQNIDALPFDLNQLRCIPYTQSITGGKKLKADLVKAIEEVADVLVSGANDGERVYTFKMQEDEKFIFPHRLMGAGRYLYDFELTADYIGSDGAKLTMQITKYPAGGSPKQLEKKDFGFPVGDRAPIQEIQRILELKEISRNVATFKLTPQQES
jgi:hypothetical protein